jgi:hypothetical protein
VEALRTKEDGHSNAESEKRECTGRSGELQSVGNSRGVERVEREDEIAREGDIGGGTKNALDNAALCGIRNGCRETIAVR